MLEALQYTLLQCLGYRQYYFDWALNRGIQLQNYSIWNWELWKPMGTYREWKPGKYYHTGFGPDK